MVGGLILAIDPNRYAEFVGSINLISITVGECHACRGNHVPPQKSLTVKVRGGAHVADDHATMEAFIACDIAPPDADESPFPALDSPERATMEGYRISVRYVAKYGTKDGATIPDDEEMTEEFTRRSAMLHVWPFIREHVASESQRMGITPPLMLNLRLIPTQ